MQNKVLIKKNQEPFNGLDLIPGSSSGEQEVHNPTGYETGSIVKKTYTNPINS